MTNRNIDYEAMKMNIKKEVERAGYRYIDDRPLTDHPADWYLRVVLGMDNKGVTFATWVYNAEFNGLYEGHYDMKEHDYYERI